MAKAILLKSYEKESIFKNFLVFFSLLIFLLITLFVQLYYMQIREYRQNLYKNMQLCSYTIECDEYTIGFAEKNKHHYNELYEINGSLIGYFVIPDSEKFDLQLSYPKSKYYDDLHKIQADLLIKFIFATFILLVIALFFTLYSLHPIRKALALNDEFIKDILHDFNTPITSIALNMRMLEEDKGDNPFIDRIRISIDNILLLQKNLKCFLQHSPLRNQSIDVADLVQARLGVIEPIYPKILFHYEKKNHLTCLANEEMLIRIFDNILSNAAKYNKPKGKVYVCVEGSIVSIEDTGKGIRDISKVMQRYYKEQDRGLGLGLHIVNKLADELNIVIKVSSEIGIGTKFILDFKNIQTKESK